MRERIRINIVSEDVSDIEENPSDTLLLLAESAEGGDGGERVGHDGVSIDAAAEDAGEQVSVGFALAEVEGVAEGNHFRLVCVGEEAQSYLCGRGTCRIATRAAWWEIGSSCWCC